jgi:hypothetical protein
LEDDTVQEPRTHPTIKPPNISAALAAVEGAPLLHDRLTLRFDALARNAVDHHTAAATSLR